MALDRRITIQIEAPGRRATQDDVDAGLMVDGELVGVADYIPGPTTLYPVWAERRAAGSSDQPTPAGFITVSAQNYGVRWFRELELSDIALVMVEDEYGVIWDADSISPNDARRRFINLPGFADDLMPAQPMRLASMSADATAGGSVSLRVRGGGKLRRFVFRANDPVLIARLATAAVRRLILPGLKVRMPRRTGDLINSLQIRQNGTRIELWGIFYSTFVTVDGSLVVIKELMELLEMHRQAISNEIIRGLQ